MSEKTVRVCDVCGRVFKDVKTYRITVGAASQLQVLDQEVDLCPNHFVRLKGFVERGCSPLKGKA